MKDMTSVQWRKSSKSDHSGGNCVEVASLWRKSSHSDHSGGDCVEVADLAPMVGVRDSKNPEGPKLTFSASAWSAFTRSVKSSAHDLT
jgi:hypothetical protein